MSAFKYHNEETHYGVLCDMDSFYATARACERFNPHFTGQEVSDIVSHMVGTLGSSRLNKAGYVATGGYMLTLYDRCNGGLGCVASFCARLFGEFLEKESNNV